MLINTKEKIKNSKIKNESAKGSNNPNYGKCFISKLNDIKTVALIYLLRHRFLKINFKKK